MQRYWWMIAALLCVGCKSAPPAPAQTTPTTVQTAQPECSPATPAVVDARAGAPDERVVVIEGAPSIDAAVKERLRRYTNVRAAIFEGVSDDGKSVLLTTRFGDTSQLHRVGQPLGAREQLTFEDEPIADARVIPGQADSFIYSRDVGGAENYQLFRLDAKTGKATLLTDGKSRTEAFVIARNGKQLAYASNARNGRDMDIYVGDGVSAGSHVRVLEREGTFVPVDFSFDGKKLLVAQEISINHRPLYLLDLETKKLTLLSPEANCKSSDDNAQRTCTPAAAYRTALFSPDGRTVYVTSDREGEHVEAYALSLDADNSPKGFRPLTRGVPWSIEELALSHDGRTLAALSNEDGYGVLRLLDTKTGSARLVKSMPRGLVLGMRFAENSQTLGFTLASASQSGDVFTLDVNTSKLTRFTKSEIGGLDATRFVEPELVRLKSFDGLEIPAFYYRPTGKGPFPVVIDIHGGPESQARPAFSAMTQYLAGERNIAVLVPNVRGSDGYGKSYLLLDNGMKREDSVKDIGALLDWVGTRPELDKSKIGVSGGSYGGYMVLASLMHYSERIRAGVDVVGIASFITFLENTSEYRRDLRRVEYGDERDPEMRKHLEAISPAGQPERIQSALFVAHGANDPRVPLGEAEQIAKAVRARGKPVWTMIARNEGHGFRKKANRDQLMALMGMFWEQNLR